MRSRRSAQEEVAAVARRRLEQLSAELAGIRPGPADPRLPDGPDEPGELPDVPAGAVSSSLTRSGRHALRSPREAMVSGWLQDRLPPSLQGRVQIGTSHLTVIAVVVAAALAVTCWWVLRSGAGTTVPPVAAMSATTSATSLVSPRLPSPVAPAAAATSPSASSTIIVDVAGKVRRPGIATLPLGARVVDAIKAAGGVRKGVSLHSLNLARVLVDGEQVVVGLPSPAGVAASAASAPQGGGGAATPMVNINTAGQSELETLPGVGPVTAASILQWRTENGAFSSVDELLEVSGIGDATLAEMAPFVTL
jgi:competence protein ComEA